MHLIHPYSLATLLCLLLSLTPAPAESRQEETLVARTVASGPQSRIVESICVAIQTEAHWRTWWKDNMHASDQPQSPETQPPKVDFSKETILVASMGRRSTGGHHILFSGFRRKGGTLIATIVTKSPAPDTRVTMALTHPFIIAAIPKHEGPIEFERK